MFFTLSVFNVNFLKLMKTDKNSFSLKLLFYYNGTLFSSVSLYFFKEYYLLLLCVEERNDE